VTACEQDQDVRSDPARSPDDGQKNCPKHVEFYSKNKFEKLVHPVGFIIRIYHDARSPELQIVDHIRFQLTFRRLTTTIMVVPHR